MSNQRYCTQCYHSNVYLKPFSNIKMLHCELNLFEDFDITGKDSPVACESVKVIGK